MLLVCGICRLMLSFRLFYAGKWLQFWVYLSSTAYILHLVKSHLLMRWSQCLYPRAMYSGNLSSLSYPLTYVLQCGGQFFIVFKLLLETSHVPDWPDLEFSCACMVLTDLSLLVCFSSCFLRSVEGNHLSSHFNGTCSQFLSTKSKLANLVQTWLYEVMKYLFWLSCQAICLIMDLFQESKCDRMANADLVTVDGLFQVMHVVLKHLKKDNAEESASVHIHSLISSVINIPWNLLDEIFEMPNNEAHVSCNVNAFLKGKSDYLMSRMLFLGTLLQLLCSLADQCVLIDTDREAVLDNIARLIPKLLSWCFAKQDPASNGISQYLRHKILMLMVRLSFLISWECSDILFWVQLLRKYFNDLLCQPISRSYVDADDCLNGSPFLASIAHGEETYRFRNCHLQRQAILLFLKCSLSFVRLSNEADPKCSCDLLPGEECCNSKKVLAELLDWLQRHVSVDKFVDNENCTEECRDFALSFLQLYMDEDDFLFEALLQLSSLPFLAEQVEISGECNRKFKALKDEILFLVSNIFNPVHLFHIFLAELHYDHLVLLDYLISEDIGICCLQYLLRALRTVSNTWPLFVEFQVCRGETSSSSKKRKTSVNDLVYKERIEFSSSAENGAVPIPIVDGQSKTCYFGCEIDNQREMMFQNAKRCLLSLKQSIKDLNSKNLFPYNPAALLRSLDRFELLCHQQGKDSPHQQGDFNFLTPSVNV
ncbi:hypothetical protein Syun_005252 [Stephania yunnanensis]|uniref:Protein Lines C-terminal domain-containing protein n=1 Tax=Stephania yunnanensis TaxID=152371 RepID=A0AAP0Q247_9MAGN